MLKDFPELTIKFNIKLKTFSKIFTLLRLISSLRVTDNMNTFYNHFLARDTTLIPVNPYILNNCN